jgi:hypothetical protein
MLTEPGDRHVVADIDCAAAGVRRREGAEAAARLCPSAAATGSCLLLMRLGG